MKNIRIRLAKQQDIKEDIQRRRAGGIQEIVHFFVVDFEKRAAHQIRHAVAPLFARGQRSRPEPFPPQKALYLALIARNTRKQILKGARNHAPQFVRNVILRVCRAHHRECFPRARLTATHCFSTQTTLDSTHAAR